MIFNAIKEMKMRMPDESVVVTRKKNLKFFATKEKNFDFALV